MKQRSGDVSKAQHRTSCCAFFSALLLEVLAWGLAVVAITTSFWLGAPGVAALPLQPRCIQHARLTAFPAAPRQHPRRARCRR